MNDLEQQQLIGRHYSKRLRKWIDEYEKPSGYPFSRIRLERILRFLERKEINRETILDVGCGVGIPGMELARSDSDLYGFDLSPELVEWARDLAKNAQSQRSMWSGVPRKKVVILTESSISFWLSADLP